MQIERAREIGSKRERERAVLQDIEDSVAEGEESSDGACRATLECKREYTPFINLYHYVITVSLTTFSLNVTHNPYGPTTWDFEPHTSARRMVTR